MILLVIGNYRELEMEIIRGTKNILSRRVRSSGTGSHTITGSIVVVLIISLSVLLVGIIS